MGAGLVHTEMVSAVVLSYKNKKTSDLLGDESEPGPIALQLFSPDAESLAKGAGTALERRRFDALEINMACPMPKVARKGSGAKLLERPEEARRMVGALKKFCLPVWVKLRIMEQTGSGFSTEKFCEALLGAGADLLLIHGRTPSQRYEGSADKGKVCAVAAKFPGLVAASGDFFTPRDAIYYIEGGCSAVLAARGALRDANLIPKTLGALGFSVPENLANPTLSDQIDLLTEVGRLGAAREGERLTLVLIRRMLPGVFKGFPGASNVRRSCAECGDWRSVEELFDDVKREGAT
jgi:tRNA-dihydrouridine synthase B